MRIDAALPSRKVVVVGDGDTGKTSMLYMVSKGTFPETHVPTIMETEVVKVAPATRPGHVAPPPIDLVVWDTAGQEDYDRLRPLAYGKTDVFLVCFSIANPNSYLNVAEKWIPELRHFCPEAAILLVATKTDLRSDAATHRELAEIKRAPVTTSEGQTLCRTIQARAFLECSCKDEDSIHNVFKAAATVAYYNQNSCKKPRPCVLL